MTLERGLMGHHQIPVTWLVGLLPSKCELVLLSLTGRYSKNRKNNICTHQIFNVTRNILSLSYCNHFKRSLHVRGCWEGQTFFLSFYHLGNKEHAGKHRMDWEKIPSKNRLFDVHYSSPNIPRFVIYSKHFTVSLAIFRPDFTTYLRHRCIVRIMYLKILVSKHQMDMLLQR